MKTNGGASALVFFCLVDMQTTEWIETNIPPGDSKGYGYGMSEKSHAGAGFGDGCGNGGGNGCGNGGGNGGGL